ncbi:MAG: Dockerin type 1 [Parcubacteria group bacterium Gr01-1014_17]|nr:MAG: Dockerin type 1 [Parcubacteria group bacterium Gr01-1014_17]
MRKNSFVILTIAILFLISGTNSFASEILCTLSLTATSTGCAPAQSGFVAFAPSAIPSAGTYNAAQSIALSADSSTSIRYTTDGTTPTCASGAIYSVPISVKKTQTIKAISCYPNSTESTAVSFSYLLSLIDARTENAALTTVGVGSAALPNQATSVKLSNTTSLDVSASVNTASAGQVIIGGAVKNLSAFTNGNLVSVDLSIPIFVGGQTVSVGKAVVIQGLGRNHRTPKSRVAFWGTSRRVFSRRHDF